MNSKDKRIKQAMKAVSKYYSFNPPQAGFKVKREDGVNDYHAYRSELTEERRRKLTTGKNLKGKIHKPKGGTKMKKVITSIIVGLFLTITSQAMALTATKSFVVSATLGAATSISIDANSIVGSGSSATWTSMGSTTNMTFSPLTLAFNNATPPASLGIYLPNNYFAIDIGTGGGAGYPDTTFTYTEGTNPNSTNTVSPHGLGWKSTATFMKVTGASASQIETAVSGISGGARKLLKDLAGTGTTVQRTQVAGGFLRVYIGVNTLDPAAVPVYPSGSEAFTGLDTPGTYDGTLVVSATL